MPTTTVSPSPVVAGAPFTATITGWSGNTAEFIAVYQTDTETSFFPAPFGWITVTPTGPTTATASLPAPAVAGTYDVRLRDTVDFNIGSLTHTPLIVTTSVPEYVGIYLPSESTSPFPPALGWVNTTMISPTLATATLTAPAAGGPYSMRLRDNVNETVASLVVTPFTVAVAGAPVMVVTSPVASGATITCTITNWSGNTAEFVAIYQTDTETSFFPSPLGWVTVTPTGPSTATASLPAPALTGTYDMRLRDSTDFTVGSLLHVPFDVVMTPAAQPLSSVHFSRFQLYLRG